VLALPLPRVPRDTRNYLSRIWAFDRAPTSAHPGWSNAIGTHVDACPQVGLDVRLAESDDFAAVSAFSRRPLRFNASGTRVSTEEVAWYASQAGRDVLLVTERTARRLLAVARVRQVAGALRLDDWWVENELSVGPIEGHLLRALGRMAVSRGIEHLEIQCLRNRSNSLLRDYLVQRGGLDLEHEIHLTLAQALASVQVEQASVARGKRSVTTAAIGVPGTTQYEAGQAPPARPFRLPTTDAERWVSGVWREVLGVDRIGADDDFFALGGDSLAAARALARIRAAFGVDLPVSALFDEPTLAAQAAHLVRARIAGSDPELVRALFDQESTGEVVDD
jgi:hypothetical protein